jgi:hypothetical protein
MRTFLISYDLANPAARHSLSAEIMAMGESWARPLATTWYVRTKERQGAVEARMRRLIDAEDGVLIQEVAGDASVLNTALRWFKNRRTDAADANNIVAFPMAPAEMPAQAA